MKTTKFFKIKYTLSKGYKCKYEGYKESNFECEYVIEETTKSKAINFLKQKYTYSNGGRESTFYLKQVIEL